MVAKRRLVKISGGLPASYQSEKLINALFDSGAKSISIVSREIQIECSMDKYPIIKNTLKELKVEEIKIREARVVENTVMQAGSGKDPSGSIKVTIVPATKLTGRKLLSITLAETFEIKEDEITDFVTRSKKTIQEVLDKAGVDHCLIAIELIKRPKELDKALELAIVHTLLETNGLYAMNGLGI